MAGISFDKNGRPDREEALAAWRRYGNAFLADFAVGHPDATRCGIRVLVEVCRAALTPARSKRDKRRHSAQVTPAIRLFRQGVEMLRSPHGPYELRDLRIAIAAALGRSKFRSSPLDREPKSLIGCDVESADVALELRAQLLNEIGKGRLFMTDAE
ncbi:hypothetical protein IVB11_26755 [Bradyrhizobium sp. 177]|uniref:hypothetical protein n=1 Tax=Bradyrhizobium sp. 177 TaxID=2782647 RepID=UPI001FFAC686|nr:hypothetical protein [Bradyrhizobium sp. 177]MCK1552566.1 hypothetical protein [Bradyrhizobium sp. 177]